MVRIFCLVALLLVLLLCNVACGGELSYPPPPQRTPVAHSISHPVTVMLGMAAGEDDMPWGSITGGVKAPARRVDWRWARSHPSFEFELMDYEGWNATAHLTAVGKVLEVTGPQHVTMNVNGTPVGKVTLGSPGKYDVTFPVEADLLKSVSPIVVRLDISPCLVTDSAYCVLLHSIGFVRDTP